MSRLSSRQVSAERGLSRQPTIAEISGSLGTHLMATSYENYVPVNLCSKHGFEVLHDPVFNKVGVYCGQLQHGHTSTINLDHWRVHQPAQHQGTAFTLAERERLGLRGLLPPAITALDVQVQRIMERLDYDLKLVDPEEIQVLFGFVCVCAWNIHPWWISLVCAQANTMHCIHVAINVLAIYWRHSSCTSSPSTTRLITRNTKQSQSGWWCDTRTCSQVDGIASPAGSQ